MIERYLWSRVIGRGEVAEWYVWDMDDRNENNMLHGGAKLATCYSERVASLLVNALNREIDAEVVSDE